MSFISRLLPNPPGTDAEGEWIEICFDRDIDTALYLSDASEKEWMVVRKETGECEKLYRSDTGITLNNDKESVTLFSEKGVEDECSYTSAREGSIIICSGEEQKEIIREEARVIGVSEEIIRPGAGIGDALITGIFISLLFTGIIWILVTSMNKKTLDK